MADNKKKKIIDDATLIDASFLQPIFGGDPKAAPGAPESSGHLHDGRNDVWGHAPKIDLANHTTGRLTLQDAYAVAKSVSAYPAIIATPNNVITGTFLNVPNSSVTSKAAVTIPVTSLPNNITLTETTTLSGSINNSITTITVASTSGFADSGIITIDSEQISYTDTTATTFTGCTRGANSTTAASHSNGATVTGSVVEQLSGTLGTQSGNLPLTSGANINGVLNGTINLGLNNVFTVTGASTPVYPFTTPGIVSSAIWYFGIPLDMDVTKSAYFSFEWMGDILTTDGYGNATLDTSKLSSSGVPIAQTTTFRVTWQWYTPGYAVFPPAVIYDGYTPTNLPGTNINANTLTRGRISNLTVNDLPFKMIVNDSSSNSPNYVNLTGLQQATNATMIGIQVDVLSTGFVNSSAGTQSGHLRFYQGNLIYLSRTIGSPVISFKTL